MTPTIDADPTDVIAQTAAVRAAVLAGLGRPPGLYELAVRRLWDQHYRVNVLVGPDAVSARIAHSFFVAVAAGGGVTADPPLARRYP